jgi:hypothetical protein
MAKGRKEASLVEWVTDLADLGLPSPVSAGDGSTPTSIKSFWDSMWSPGSIGRILMEKTPFGGFSAGPSHQDHPVALIRILGSSRMAAIFARLYIAGLLYFQHYAHKVQVAAYAYLAVNMIVRCHGMGPASDGIHPQDLSLILLLPLRRQYEKWNSNWINGEPKV